MNAFTLNAKLVRLKFAFTLRMRSAGIVGADMTPGYDILDFSTITGKGD